MIEIGQLVVQFERDLEQREYPYLGQVCLLGHSLDLLEGYRCKQPVEFSLNFASPVASIGMDNILDGSEGCIERYEKFMSQNATPVWCLPEDGWETATCFEAALVANRAISAGVVDVIGELSSEVDNFVAVMDEAVKSNIRFNVDMTECQNPPQKLVKWVERDFEDTANWIREAVEESGMKINDKEL